MTESDWLACTDATWMLNVLSGQELHQDGHITTKKVKGLPVCRPTRRKSMLIHCACCRHVWTLLTDERSRKAVLVAEEFADGDTTEEAWEESQLHAREAWLQCSESECSRAAYLAWGYWNVVEDSHTLLADRFVADILRDTIGNPFRPRPSRSRKAARLWQNQMVSWLLWSDGAVSQLARTAYEERALPSGELDTARLAVLADALEEAGCDNADLLGHLRSPGPHVRGCWAVDLLLGKG